MEALLLQTDCAMHFVNKDQEHSR